MSVLVLDWDETITVKDTTALIARVAELHSPKSLPFLYFTERYLLSYNEFGTRFTDTYGSIDTIEKEVAFQQQLKEVEMLSVKRLEDFEFFKGVKTTEFVNAAKEIEIRPDCIEFLREWQSPIYILSINWCKSMIEACLTALGLEHVEVIANELGSENGITTGVFKKEHNIRTGLDKEEALTVIREKWGSSNIVYIGDSHGDILPILSADTGLLLEGGKGQDVLDKIAHIEYLPVVLQKNSLEKEPSKDYSTVAYLGSWLQITRFLKENLNN